MSIFVSPIASAYGQNVKPFDGAKYYFFETGTTTPKASYSDSAETIPQAHPVLADEFGRFPVIYISGLYKAVLDDKNDVQVWEKDGLQSTGSGVNLKGDFDSSTNAGDYPALGSAGDKYKVSTGFTLNSASGGHILQTGDFITANKAGATAIDADWDIERGVVSNIGTIALTPAANVTTDLSKATVHTLEIDQDSTLDNPSNKIVGMTYYWQITQDATAGWTLAFGTDFDFIGSSDIFSLGVTLIKGVVVSLTSIECTILSGPQRVTDFTEKNPIFDVIDTTHIGYTADSFETVNSNNIPTYIPNPDIEWNSATDTVNGQALENSHLYGCRTDSDGNKKLAIYLEGTSDIASAGFLVWAAGNAASHLFKEGAIVYNTTQKTKTTISVTPTIDGDPIELADDIFDVDNEGFFIKMQKDVTGLGDSTSEVGKVEVDSGGNFIDSTYEHIQKEKTYIGATGATEDFIVSSALGITVLARATYIIKQANDWAGKGSWWLSDLKIAYKVAGGAHTGDTVAMTGILFKNVTDYRQGFIGMSTGSAASINNSFAVQNANTISVSHTNFSTSQYLFSGGGELESKPGHHK